MSKFKHWLQDKWFGLTTGTTMKTINDGKPVKEIVIQHNNHYLSIFYDVETGEPTGDFGWSEDPTMFSVPLREIIQTESNHEKT